MPVTIRSRLLLLVLSVLLPAGLGVAWLIGRTFEAEREAHERTLRETARAMSMLVDRELARRATIARVLAQSRWLDDAALGTPAFAAFEVQARRALQGMDGWLELRAPGATLLDTRQPALATPRPGPPLLADSPRVQPLLLGDAEPFAALVEPVVRQGRIPYNLVVTVRPQEMQRLVDGMQLPRGWIGTLMDNSGHVVARHPGGEAFVGRLATADLRERLARTTEGLFESRSLDGVDTVAYYATSAHGWTWLAAMPRDQFAGVLPDAVRRIGVGALTLLALAVLGARWVSRSIVGPVQQLKAAARRMQAGEPVELRTTGIAECDDVALALAEAAESIRHARADLERQVADAVERTRQAEQRVSQSQRVEALGRLTGGVAHDFNNLLGVISNSMHLIQRHPAAAELQVPLAATQRSVEVGSQLTQHLLRFAGRRPLRPQLVAPTRYLPEIQELMRSVLGRRIDIRVDVAPDTQGVCVDSSEFELALINLALNARDAMPSGGELRLAARNAEPADTEGLPPGRYVLVTVGDDGVGIEAALAEHVFEPFFTTKAVGQGTGLGLSQVHGFAVQAGGAARLDSAPGIGTTVSLLLPAFDAEALQGPAPPPPALPSVEGLTVLLVEDNETLGDVTEALLAAHGARVQRAAGADQALAAIAADGARFDVVLSDIVMPGRIDGLELARRLRHLVPGLPVVLITGFSNAAGSADDEFTVLRKPCPEAELLAALRRAARTPA